MNARRWWPVAVVVAVVTGFYWDFLWGRTFIWGDALTEYFAGLHYFATSIQSGRFPLWIAGVRNGMPFYTDIQLAIFYPPTWLLVLPASAERLPFVAYQVFLVAHIAWGGIGMLWFLRGLGLRPVACVVGAVTFCLAAFMSLHMVHAVMLQVYVWWPWLLELVRRVVTTRSRKAVVGLVAVTAMMFLAGHPQTTLYGLYLATAYWIYLAWPVTKWWKSLLTPPVVWILTMLLLGAVLLPVAENWHLSARTQETAATNSEGSAPVANLIGLVAPNFFGTLQAEPTPVMFWGDAPWNYWEFGMYAGQLGLLAVIVLAFNRRKPAGFFLVMFGLAAWFCLGRYAGLYQVAYHLIPGAGLFRVPARAANAVCFCGAVLAAIFVDALLDRERLQLRKPLIVVGSLYAVVIVIWKWRFFPELWSSAQFAWAGQEILRAGMLALAILACVGILLSSRRWRILGGIGLIAVCVVDFWLAYGKYHRGRVNPDEYYADVNGIIVAVRQQSAEQGPFRFAQFRGTRMADEVLFPLNMGFVQRGFETPEGFTSFFLRDTGALLPMTNTAARLAVQNVGITARRDEKTGRVIVAPYRDSLLRAKFYSLIKTYRSDADVLAALDDGTLDYRSEIGVVADAWPESEGTGSVRFVSKSPEAYELHYDVTGPGIIFVSITDYPGWRAEFPIVRAFGAFQGIVIPHAGKGVVHVRFQPRVWRWGLLFSAVGAVGLVVFTASYTKRP